MLTGGGDNLIRIWEYVPQDEALLPSQSFAGHVSTIKKIVTTKSEYVISLGDEEGIYTWKLLPSGGLYDDDEGSDEEQVDEQMGASGSGGANQAAEDDQESEPMEVMDCMRENAEDVNIVDEDDEVEKESKFLFSDP